MVFFNSRSKAAPFNPCHFRQQARSISSVKCLAMSCFFVISPRSYIASSLQEMGLVTYPLCPSIVTMSTTYMLQIKSTGMNWSTQIKRQNIKTVLKNPVTLLCMSSNCNAKVYKNLVRSYFPNIFLYLINSVKSLEIG